MVRNKWLLVFELMLLLLAMVAAVSVQKENARVSFRVKVE